MAVILLSSSLAVILLSIGIFGQSDRSMVKDSNGAVIQGATVLVKNITEG